MATKTHKAAKTSRRGTPGTSKPKLDTDDKKVAAIVGFATAGATIDELVALVREYLIPVELLDLAAEGLEENAKQIRQTRQRLQPVPDDDDDV